MAYTIILALLAIAAVAVGEDSPAAKIFLHKYTTTTPIVEGSGIEIFYHAINNGDSVAFNIEVTDRYDPKRYILFPHEISFFEI